MDDHLDVCKIEGCGAPIINKRGWCNAHYQRWWKHGDPLAGRTPDGEPLRFFRDVVLPFQGDECLIWPYSKDRKGYGRAVFGGKLKYVHREACEHRHGPAPTVIHEAAHTCGNGNVGCCNPLHVEWKTPVENMADTLIHGTHNRGERQGGSKLTEADVRRIKALSGRLTQAQIARDFGVVPSLISQIHSGKRWGWLK